MCRLNVLFSEENSPNATSGKVGDSTSSKAATGNSLDDDEYADIVSLYDDLDEHAINPYEGLHQAKSSPVAQNLHATNDYTHLGAVQNDHRRKSCENVEMSELHANPDAVSQPLSNSSFRVRWFLWQWLHIPFAEADLWFLVPWARFPDCPPPRVTDRRTTVSS